MNELFNTRQDVYNFAAKLYVGEDKYEQLSKADKKKLRKNFKTVMLGVLYGLGIEIKMPSNIGIYWIISGQNR